MSSMFFSCNLLTSLDLSSFDTKNVINMSYMFASCLNLKYLSISNFVTNQVGDFSYIADDDFESHVTHFYPWSRDRLIIV